MATDQISDRVTALVGAKQIRTGDVGTVVGPCANESLADKVDRVRSTLVRARGWATTT